MNLQWAGPVLAVVTFAKIGIGHVAVRRLNYHYGTKPATYLITLGLALLAGSLFVSSNLLSAALGIIGITTLWDAYEMFRQEDRVRRGHAPANPERPVEQRRGQRGSGR